MDKFQISELLRALKDEAQDVSIKKKLKALIIDLGTTIKLASTEGLGDDKDDAPPSKNDQKIAWKIAETVGRFFSQVASKIIADKIKDNFLD